MYNYKEIKPKLMTDDGQVMFLKIRDHVHSTIKQSGAIRMQEAMSITTSDVWMQMACVDRLVELNEIEEVNQGRQVIAQHRIFIHTR